MYTQDLLGSSGESADHRPLKEADTTEYYLFVYLCCWYGRVRMLSVGEMKLSTYLGLAVTLLSYFTAKKRERKREKDLRGT